MDHWNVSITSYLTISSMAEEDGCSTSRTVGNNIVLM